MKKLRLLVTKNCNRACTGCCNKDWDLDALEKCTDFSKYNEIILTGGEPMIYPRRLLDIINKIREDNPWAKIFMYTATITPHSLEILNMLDGMTLTLHEQNDVPAFEEFNAVYSTFYIGLRKSLRLNVFKGIHYKLSQMNLWKVKDNIEWQKDCPLPKDEVFMKL